MPGRKPLTIGIFLAYYGVYMAINKMPDKARSAQKARHSKFVNKESRNEAYDTKPGVSLGYLRKLCWNRYHFTSSYRFFSASQALFPGKKIRRVGLPGTML